MERSGYDPNAAKKTTVEELARQLHHVSYLFDRTGELLNDIQGRLEKIEKQMEEDKKERRWQFPRPLPWKTTSQVNQDEPMDVFLLNYVNTPRKIPPENPSPPNNLTDANLEEVD